MTEHFRRVPFLRILLPLVAGIILANSFPVISGEWCLIILPGLLLTAAFLFFLPGYHREKAGGVVITFFFLAVGFFLTRQENKPGKSLPPGIHCATLLEKPVLKSKSYRAEGIVTGVFYADSLTRASEKIVIYFAGTEKVEALRPGTMILFDRVPEVIENRGNPYEFDYKGYIARRGIRRQVYLNGDSWRPGGNDPVFRITVYAERTRDYLLGIYRQNGLEGTEYEILSALTLGYTKSMDAEIRQVFSATGAAHVLSVSGLHVGIVYMVFNLFFGFMRRQKATRYLFLFLAVLFLWGFAFITGLSPPVQRSALMFTVVLIGDNLRRPANIYNTLASSASLILVVNPNLLLDVGFQLSYAALLGIVYFQPMLAGIFGLKSKVGIYLWGLTAVSVAAQLTTFPLSSFYFHQFPVYFWLSNFVVIPTSFLFIFLGIFILATSPVSWMCAFLTKMAALVVRWLYHCLQEIEELPGAVLSGFDFTFFSMVISFIILGSAVLFIESKRARYLLLAGTCSILFILSGTVMRVYRNHRAEIILYNHEKPLVHLIFGSRNYILAPGEVLGDDFPEMTVKPVITHYDLEEPVLIPFESEFDDSIVIMKGNYLYFDGVVLGIAREGCEWDKTLTPAIVVGDIRSLRHLETPAGSRVVCYGNLKGDPPENVHFVKEEGAYHLSIRRRSNLKISEKVR